MKTADHTNTDPTVVETQGLMINYLDFTLMPNNPRTVYELILPRAVSPPHAAFKPSWKPPGSWISNMSGLFSHDTPPDKHCAFL